MKIIQFLNTLDMGGMERLAIDLAHRQRALGHEAVIYCLRHRGYFANEAEASGIRVVAFQKGLGPSAATVYRVAKSLKKDRPDVLHTHNHLVHHYGVLAGRIAGVPAIVNTRHGAPVEIKDENSRLVSTTGSPDSKADWIYRASLRWTDAVVLISEATRQFFIRYRGCPARKTHVILNGAPLERFRSRPAAPGAARPVIRFGTASRMVPDKDHFTLISAFAEVASALPHAELHLAGDGALRPRIEAMVTALNLQTRVVFHGAVRDLSDFLSHLDIFVLSSVNEGLPIVILEAMAAGLPIVSTRVGGVAEAAVEGLNARFAEPGDAKSVAREMLEMAACQDLAAIGAYGRELVAERFQIDRTWLEYEMLFEDVRSGRHARN